MQALRKNRHQPCFGYYLQGAVKVISMVNLIHLAFGLVLNIMLTIRTWKDLDTSKHSVLEISVQLLIWISLWIIAVFVTSLDLFLIKSYRSKNTKGLYRWTICSLINTTFFVTIYSLKTYYLTPLLSHLALLIGHFIYKYYSFWVVYEYANELLQNLEYYSNIRDLTAEEVKEFEEGVQKSSLENLNSIPVACTNRYSVFTKPISHQHYGVSDTVYKKYLRETYEISVEQLIIHDKVVLGSGAHGNVYKGEFLCLESDGSSVVVAVKTIKREKMDVELFKALLSELKVLCYLGKHENVVSLIGAHTAEIQKRKLYMVIEFCAHGCLNDYLRGCRGFFQNYVRNGVLMTKPKDYYSNCHQDDAITTIDLLKWCYQTADGMAYLESRNVVHADLAARNILITELNNVKISDFGLSRQLYQYSVYIRKQDDIPLPWRWMALETLVDMQYSTKSDVWAYGVTVWEIFSLGQMPLENEKFSLEFMNNLQKGVRLEKPLNCTIEIYSVVMDCWQEETLKRPSFNQLSSFFKEKHDFLTRAKLCHNENAENEIVLCNPQIIE